MPEQHPEWVWKLARVFARARRGVRTRTGLRLRGLGLLLSRLRRDYVFEAYGFRWFLDHRIARTYTALFEEARNEPGTHHFLRYIADSVASRFVFINVGANIGEMAIPMASHGNCARVIAFEPHPVCGEVLLRNAYLNRLANMDVRTDLVGDGAMQPYWIDPSASPQSGIRYDMKGIPLMSTVRLDDVLHVEETCVMLIDVEGAELDVLKGASTLLRAIRPLIIFEYHAETRKRFSLQEVRAEIGDDYTILRLRDDGLLDTELTDTFNCVAVHAASPFHALAHRFMAERA